MEQNKKIEKSSKDKKVVVVISLIIVMILISVAVIFNKDKLFNNTEVKNVETQEKIEDNNNTQIEDNKHEEELSEYEQRYNNMKKSVNEYVEDSNYIEEKETKTVTVNLNSKEESFKTTDKIIVPYIKVNSEEAKKANKEIEELANKQYELFGKKNGENSNVTSMDYYCSDTGNSISILIIYNTQISGTNDLVTMYKTYNISKYPEEEKSYIIDWEIEGYSKETVNNKINEFNEKSIKQGATKNKLKLINGEYFDKNGSLNVICTGGLDSNGVRNENIHTIFDVTTSKEVIYNKVEDILMSEYNETIEYSNIIKINNNTKIDGIECISLWNDFEDVSKNKITLNGRNKNGSNVWSYEIKDVPHSDATSHTFNIIGVNDNKLYIFIRYDTSYESELDSKIIAIDINNGNVISTTKCPYVYNPKMAIDENGNKYIAGFGGQGVYELDFIILDSNDQYIKKVSTDNEIFLNKIDDANSSLEFLEMKEENGEKYLSGYVYETEKSNILISLNLLLQKDNITKEDAFIK